MEMHYHQPNIVKAYSIGERSIKRDKLDCQLGKSLLSFKN